MSCGGNMMRTSQQPLAHLVDAAALRWLAVEEAADTERAPVQQEITATFSLANKPEITYHGLKYLLTIRRTTEANQELIISVHEKALDI